MMLQPRRALFAIAALGCGVNATCSGESWDVIVVGKSKGTFQEADADFAQGPGQPV